MKNVAGYDVSRLLAGSLGMLGVICEVSLKVLPLAAGHGHAALRDGPGRGARAAQRLGRPAAAAERQRLVGRHAGACACAARARRWRRPARSSAARRSSPRSAQRVLGRACATSTDEFFVSARDGGRRRRRAVAPVGAADRAPLALPGEQLIEWGGAQRWLCTRRAGGAGARRGGRAPAATPRCSARSDKSRAACSRRCRAPLDAHPPRAEAARSIRTASSTPAACTRASEQLADANQPRPRIQRHAPTARRPRPSCASACTAASAPPPARPTSCSATSSTARAAAST